MRYRLADHGLVFSTRDRGARILADVREKLGANTMESLVVDLADVKSISYSFVDEFLGELFTEASSIGHWPVLANVPASAARTIERSLLRRGLEADRAHGAVLETA